MLLGWWFDCAATKIRVPRANWTTPSQVSTLEPLLELCWDSLWCPPNHISLSFPIWGSCTWFMNLKIHIFGMKMSWFLCRFIELYWSGNGSFSFLAICADEERSNSWQKPFQFSQLFVTSSLALCHLRNDRTSTCRERILPLLDTCPCSN